MFIIRTSSGYRQDGQQWARGAFLMCALPDRRPSRWHMLQAEAQRVATQHALEAGRPEWAWRDYLSLIEKGQGFGEVFYHPPFTEMRCFVRHVILRQMGHFMVGDMKLGSQQIYVEGTYGGNGLPKTLPREVWQAGLILPNDLCELWATAKGGHNSAGSEGLLIRRWARDNINALRRAGSKL